MKLWLSILSTPHSKLPSYPDWLAQAKQPALNKEAFVSLWWPPLTFILPCGFTSGWARSQEHCLPQTCHWSSRPGTLPSSLLHRTNPEICDSCSLPGLQTFIFRSQAGQCWPLQTPAANTVCRYSAGQPEEHCCRSLHSEARGPRKAILQSLAGIWIRWIKL